MKDEISNINDFLTGLNIDEKLSSDQKIARLNDVIDSELEKPEADIDETLVSSCLGAIKELENGRFEIGPGELEEKLQKIIKKAKRKTYAPRINIKPIFAKPTVKFAAVLAAAFVVFFSLASVVSVASVGYDSIDKWVNDNAKKLYYLLPGKYKIDGHDVVIGSSIKQYKNVEAFAQEENPDFMYPGKLPEGDQIKDITKSFLSENDNFDIVFVFDSPNGHFSVCNYNLHYYDYNSENQVEINGCVFNIVENSAGGYQANYVDGKYAYTLVYGDYEGLIYILENLCCP